MSNPQLHSIETYHRLMNINGASHVLRTTVRLGIIDALVHGQKTAIQLKEICNLKLEPLELLLAVACQTGLIEKYGDDYALSQTGRLLPSDFRDLGDHYWQYLENFVRSGQRIPDDEEIPQQDGDYLTEMASAEWIMTPAALAAIEILDIPQTRHGKRILQIGAGAAVFGMAILHHDPTSHLTALDTKQNLKRAERTAESIDKLESVDFLEGDYRSMSFPAECFDMVILENILHRERLDTVNSLLERINDSLRTHGEVVILDVFPGQDAGKVTRELFQLALHLRLSTGTLHSPEDLKHALLQQGFDRISFAHIDTPPFIHGMIVARKIDQSL
jgi:C-methyltransferase